jgi:hypothetical protein
MITITTTTNEYTPSRTSRAASATPIVFVVNEDVAVRDTLELLIEASGWQPETFASAPEFLARPRPSVPSCLVVDVTPPDATGLDLQSRVAVDRSGALLAMTAETMIPEAFHNSPRFSGLLAALGFGLLLVVDATTR